MLHNICLLCRCVCLPHVTGARDEMYQRGPLNLVRCGSLKDYITNRGMWQALEMDFCPMWPVLFCRNALQTRESFLLMFMCDNYLWITFGVIWVFVFGCQTDLSSVSRHFLYLLLFPHHHAPFSRYSSFLSFSDFLWFFHSITHVALLIILSYKRCNFYWTRRKVYNVCIQHTSSVCIPSACVLHIFLYWCDIIIELWSIEKQREKNESCCYNVFSSIGKKDSSRLLL